MDKNGTPAITKVTYRHDRLHAPANQKHFDKDVSAALEYARDKSIKTKFRHRVFVHWDDGIREMIIFIKGIYHHTHQSIEHFEGKRLNPGHPDRRIPVEAMLNKGSE